MSRGGFRFNTSVNPDFAEVRNGFTKGSDPDFLYYNAQIINNTTSTISKAEDPSINFQDTRTISILQDKSKFAVSIENFTLNGVGKNLPLFIPQIRQLNVDGSKNTNPNNTVYDITFTWQYGGTKQNPSAIYQSTRSIQWIPENQAVWQGTPPPIGQYSYPQPEIPYYYCYTYSHWLKLVNNALSCAWQDVKLTATTGGVAGTTILINSLSGSTITVSNVEGEFLVGALITQTNSNDPATGEIAALSPFVINILSGTFLEGDSFEQNPETPNQIPGALLASADIQTIIPSTFPIGQVVTDEITKATGKVISFQGNTLVLYNVVGTFSEGDIISCLDFASALITTVSEQSIVIPPITFGTKCPFYKYDPKTNLFSLWQDSNTCVTPFGLPTTSEPYGPSNPPSALDVFGASTATGYEQGEYSYIGYNTNFESLMTNFNTTYYSNQVRLDMGVSITSPEGFENCEELIGIDTDKGSISIFNDDQMVVTWSSTTGVAGSNWSFASPPLKSAEQKTLVVGSPAVFQLDDLTEVGYIKVGTSIRATASNNVSGDGNVTSITSSAITLLITTVANVPCTGANWTLTLTPNTSTTAMNIGSGTPFTLNTSLLPSQSPLEVGYSIEVIGDDEKVSGSVLSYQETLGYTGATGATGNYIRYTNPTLYSGFNPSLTYEAQVGQFDTDDLIVGQSSGAKGQIVDILSGNSTTGNNITITNQSGPFGINDQVTVAGGSAVIAGINGPNQATTVVRTGIMSIAPTYTTNNQQTFYSGPFAVGDRVVVPGATTNNGVITQIEGPNGYTTLSCSSQKNPFAIGHTVDCYPALPPSGNPVASGKIVDIIGDNLGYGTVNFTNQNGKFGIGESIVNNNTGGVATIVSIQGDNNGYGYVSYINQVTTGAPGSFVPNEFLQIKETQTVFAKVVLDKQNVINQTEGNIGTVTCIMGQEINGIFYATANAPLPATGLIIEGTDSGTTADIGGVAFTDSGVLTVNNVTGVFYVGDLMVDSVGYGLPTSRATTQSTATCNGFSYINNSQIIIKNTSGGQGVPDLFPTNSFIVDSDSQGLTNPIVIVVQNVTAGEQFYQGDPIAVKTSDLVQIEELQAGFSYTIETPGGGDSDFVAVGAYVTADGVPFQATGAGSGTGTAIAYLPEAPVIPIVGARKERYYAIAFVGTTNWRANVGGDQLTTPYYEGQVLFYFQANTAEGTGTVYEVTAIPATAMVRGKFYVIANIDDGSTDFRRYGCAYTNSVGNIFQATGPGTGGGIVIEYKPHTLPLSITILSPKGYYVIDNAGTSNFTNFGASSNATGTIFTATGPGTGVGTAFANVSGSVVANNGPFPYGNPDTTTQLLTIIPSARTPPWTGALAGFPIYDSRLGTYLTNNKGISTAGQLYDGDVVWQNMTPINQGAGAVVGNKYTIASLGIGVNWNENGVVGLPYVGQVFTQITNEVGWLGSGAVMLPGSIPIVDAQTIQPFLQYVIVTLGDTNWSKIGADSTPAVGELFTANINPVTGNGEVLLIRNQAVIDGVSPETFPTKLSIVNTSGQFATGNLYTDAKYILGNAKSTYSIDDGISKQICPLPGQEVYNWNGDFSSVCVFSSTIYKFTLTNTSIVVGDVLFGQSSSVYGTVLAKITTATPYKYYVRCYNGSFINGEQLTDLSNGFATDASTVTDLEVAPKNNPVTADVNFVQLQNTADPIPVTSLASGFKYTIATLGILTNGYDTNWAAIGVVGGATIGKQFTYNGTAATGTGTVVRVSTTDALGVLPFIDKSNCKQYGIDTWPPTNLVCSGADLTLSNNKVGFVVGSLFNVANATGRVTSVNNNTIKVAFTNYTGLGFSEAANCNKGGTLDSTTTISKINYFTFGVLGSSLSAYAGFTNYAVTVSQNPDTTGLVDTVTSSASNAFVQTSKPPATATALTITNVEGTFAENLTIQDQSTLNYGKIQTYEDTTNVSGASTILTLKNVVNSQYFIQGTKITDANTSTANIGSVSFQNGELMVKPVSGTFIPGEFIKDLTTNAEATYISLTNQTIESSGSTATVIYDSGSQLTIEDVTGTFTIGNNITSSLNTIATIQGFPRFGAGNKVISGSKEATVVSDSGTSLVVERVSGNFASGNVITSNGATATLTSVSDGTLTILPSSSGSSSSWRIEPTPLTSSSNVTPFGLTTYTTNLSFEESIFSPGDDLIVTEVNPILTIEQIYYPENVVQVDLSAGNASSQILESAFPSGVVGSQYVVLVQDYESTSSLWSPVASIVIGTQFISVREEYSGTPITLGNGNLGSNASTGSFQKVLLETPLDLLPQTGWRGLLSYTPKVETLSSLGLSQEDLKNLDVQLYWRNRLTNSLVPLTLYNGGSANIRIQFKKIHE